jgi:hypothetical protein
VTPRLAPNPCGRRWDARSALRIMRSTTVSSSTMSSSSRACGRLLMFMLGAYRPEGRCELRQFLRKERRTFPPVVLWARYVRLRLLRGVAATPSAPAVLRGRSPHAQRNSLKRRE